MRDTHNLTRFVHAQQVTYCSVVEELRRGSKRGHWMWYIFPQLVGLGTSVKSQLYAIKSIEEAKAYYAHPILGKRLQECTRLVMYNEDRTAKEIFGYIDNLKFHSCMTLFSCATGASEFRDALDKCFDGEADYLTIGILKKADG
ncbi:MAG: DUF1810 domain-containing protein [Chlorobiales bacterium]|nr:DUF1810 domain-containing protein [Chlorobiales bacterium]